MTPEISWYNKEHTALFIRYEVGWTWDQHHALVTRIRQMSDEGRINPILCLFDLRGTTVPVDSLEEGKALLDSQIVKMQSCATANRKTRP